MTKRWERLVFPFEHKHKIKTSGNISRKWCPGWESNDHEEKSPEDFKFHSNEESTAYTECDETLRIVTSVTIPRA
jgi:hypothetical protein